MNIENKDDIKQIIHSIFLSSKDINYLEPELCEDYYQQIAEVIHRDSFQTDP